MKTPIGGLVRNGCLDASTDADTVRGWWRRVPEANIGLRTGVAFEVLDVDGQDAIDAIKTVAADYKHEGPVGATGKGWHMLFAPSGAKNGARLLQAPLDYRGLNGYIVAPPSIHPDGHSYKWIRDARDLPHIPDWLRPILFPPVVERVYNDLDHIAALKAEMPEIQHMINLLAITPLQPAGHKNGKAIWKTRCFLGTHSDTDPSLFVYEWDQSFFCQGCREYGDQLNLQNFINNGRLR